MNADVILFEIRRKRLSLEYSQEYMASMLSISQSNYNRIESGSILLTLPMLFDIIKILELDFNEITSKTK